MFSTNQVDGQNRNRNYRFVRIFTTRHHSVKSKPAFALSELAFNRVSYTIGRQLLFQQFSIHDFRQSFELRAGQSIPARLAILQGYPIPKQFVRQYRFWIMPRSRLVPFADLGKSLASLYASRKSCSILLSIRMVLKPTTVWLILVIASIIE